MPAPHQWERCTHPTVDTGHVFVFKFFFPHAQRCCGRVERGDQVAARGSPEGAKNGRFRASKEDGSTERRTGVCVCMRVLTCVYVCVYTEMRAKNRPVSVR